jgi:hypothetical protein
MERATVTLRVPVRSGRVPVGEAVVSPSGGISIELPATNESRRLVSELLNGRANVLALHLAR